MSRSHVREGTHLPEQLWKRFPEVRVVGLHSRQEPDPTEFGEAAPWLDQQKQAVPKEKGQKSYQKVVRQAQKDGIATYKQLTLSELAGILRLTRSKLG